MIVDEINTLEDVQVVQSIVARGIKVIAGASACTSLVSLLTNPDLSSLVRHTTTDGSSVVPRGRPRRYDLRHTYAALESRLQNQSQSVLTVNLVLNHRVLCYARGNCNLGTCLCMRTGLQTRTEIGFVMLQGG